MEKSKRDDMKDLGIMDRKRMIINRSCYFPFHGFHEFLELTAFFGVGDFSSPFSDVRLDVSTEGDVVVGRNSIQASVSIEGS